MKGKVCRGGGDKGEAGSRRKSGETNSHVAGQDQWFIDPGSLTMCRIYKRENDKT